MLINEHDKTKDMLAKMRGLLTEQEPAWEETNVAEPEAEEETPEAPQETAGDVITMEGGELDEEIQKFKDAVSKPKLPSMKISLSKSFSLKPYDL